MDTVVNLKCETWTCRIGHWWHHQSPRSQNLIVGLGTLGAVVLVTLLAKAFGLGSDSHWIWHITN